MAVTITFVALNVNNNNRDSSISIGEVAQPNWAAHGKSSGALNNFLGASLVLNNVNNVLDTDVTDTPVVDIGIAPTLQNQQV